MYEIYTMTLPSTKYKQRHLTLKVGRPDYNTAVEKSNVTVGTRDIPRISPVV